MYTRRSGRCNKRQRKLSSRQCRNKGSVYKERVDDVGKAGLIRSEKVGKPDIHRFEGNPDRDVDNQPMRTNARSMNKRKQQKQQQKPLNKPITGGTIMA